MRIYADYPLDASSRSLLERVTAGEDVWIAGGNGKSEADKAAFLEAEVAFGEVPKDFLPLAKRLRWLQLPSVGTDYYRGVDWAALGPGLTCTNLRGVFTEAVVQSALAAILGFYRGIAELVRLQDRRDWQKMALRPRLRVLSQAHILFLGWGDLAAALQASLSNFGCTATTYARASGDIHTRAELDSALPRADIVCAALPDTPGTRDLLDRKRFARFKAGALFVNIGRGSLADESALIDALRSGHLGGAVLDVTRREPLPPDDPLWTAPNILLTQHTAAGSDREFSGAIEFFGENLRRYRNGLPLANVVDWKRGY